MDPATFDLITKLISSLGFPIFVAVWLLIRTDGLLKELKTTMESLKDVIEKNLGR